MSPAAQRIRDQAERELSRITADPYALATLQEAVDRAYEAGVQDGRRIQREVTARVREAASQTTTESSSWQ